MHQRHHTYSWKRFLRIGMKQSLKNFQISCTCVTDLLRRWIMLNKSQFRSILEILLIVRRFILVRRNCMFQFLAQEQIGICHLLPYMSVTYDYAGAIGVSFLYGFLCPSGISLMPQSEKEHMKRVKESRKNRSQYIVDVFEENASKGEVFLAPYNAAFQWVLCVIDPYNNVVYYLDSLHNPENIGTSKGIREDLREIVDVAMFQFRSEKEITTKLKMDTKWQVVKCPRQTNVIDCGYFVMRFMKEIVSHRHTKIPESYFSDCQFSTYQQSDLDEVRIEWARHIFRHM